MTKIEDGGPAFARSAAWGSPSNVSPSQDGMALRDWFAGQALAGVVQTCNMDTLNKSTTTEQHFAGQSYAIADAMIAARKGGADGR